MSPTNFGDLRSDQPAPTGLCQVKRGASAVEIGWSNAYSARPIEDGAGNPMRIAITPIRAGMWLIRAEMIWRTGDPVWSYFHWGVRLTPADADGWFDDRNHHTMHSALGWTESCLNTAFKLSAGVAYTCDMYWPNSSSGYGQIYYCDPAYHGIVGEFLEDGVL